VAPQHHRQHPNSTPDDPDPEGDDDSEPVVLLLFAMPELGDDVRSQAQHTGRSEEHAHGPREQHVAPVSKQSWTLQAGTCVSEKRMRGGTTVGWDGSLCFRVLAAGGGT
jgi:hypothetical protein